MRRQTVIDMVNTMVGVANTAPQQHDIQFAAVSFSTTSTTMFDFMALGCDSSSVTEAVELMPLKSTGATVVDTGFARARDMLIGENRGGFRNFDVPLVIITITDGDTLEAVRLRKMLASHPFDKPSRDLLLLSIDDGEQLSEEEADDDYYTNFYSSAESIAATFKAVGRDHQFKYACEGEGNDATLRGLTETILQGAPCTARVPRVCDATTRQATKRSGLV